MIARTKPQGPTTGMGELLEDMEAVVGYEHLGAKKRGELIRAQRQVYTDLTSIMEKACRNNVGEVYLDRSLEKRIAQIYAEKQHALSLIAGANAERAANDAEAEVNHPPELNAEQQETMGGIAQELQTRTGQFVQYIKYLFGQRDKAAEDAMRNQLDAAGILEARRILDGKNDDNATWNMAA